MRVDCEGELRVCSLRGRFREESTGRSPVVVGDRVTISPSEHGEGVLETIEPRRTELVRGTAGGAGVIMAANMDALLILVAARQPPPRWALVDRMLVAAEHCGLEAAIAINKWDQLEEEPGPVGEVAAVVDVYRQLRYPVYRLSVARREGLEPLGSWLGGRTTIVAGHSGVGKSSLLNVLVPDLDLSISEVNQVTGKGRHTTSATTLYRLPEGGYLADSPGFREFVPHGLTPAEVSRNFREFREPMAACRFSDCLHRTEPRCGVRVALEEGRISKLRYDNYLLILSTGF